MFIASCLDPYVGSVLKFFHATGIHLRCLPDEEVRLGSNPRTAHQVSGATRTHTVTVVSRGATQRSCLERGAIARWAPESPPFKDSKPRLTTDAAVSAHPGWS